MLSENILVLTNWSCSDALIQTYTLPYVRIMRKHLNEDKKIWLATLEKEPIPPLTQMDIESDLKSEAIHWLPSSYVSFGLMAFVKRISDTLKLLFFCYQNRIKVIHVWCTPPGVLGYLLSILTGATLVLDSYEPHAEAMVENGTWSRKSFRFKLLFQFEKWMSNKATIVISATEGMANYALKKYNVRFKEFYVKPACVDLSLFNLNQVKSTTLASSLGIQDKIIMVYAGKFEGIYLGVEVFDFAKIAYDYFGEDFRFLLLTSHKKEEINNYCEKASLPTHVVISKFVKHSEIASYMGLADFALTPVKPVPTKRYCTPIKDGEYWALGLPVVITKDISDDSYIIEKEGIGAVLNSLSSESYTNAIEQINKLIKKENRQEIRSKIRKVAEKYRSFEIAETVYSKIYN